MAGDFTDTEIVAAIEKMTAEGGRTFHIANRLTGHDNGVGKAFLRGLNRRLLKMETAALVRRNERRSYPNSYFWEVA